MTSYSGQELIHSSKCESKDVSGIKSDMNLVMVLFIQTYYQIISLSNFIFFIMEKNNNNKKNRLKSNETLWANLI